MGSGLRREGSWPELFGLPNLAQVGNKMLQLHMLKGLMTVHQNPKDLRISPRVGIQACSKLFPAMRWLLQTTASLCELLGFFSKPDPKHAQVSFDGPLRNFLAVAAP